MYDRFVERLSKSEYKDNFILKGGFYLSKLFGLDNRSTWILLSFTLHNRQLY